MITNLLIVFFVIVVALLFNDRLALSFRVIPGVVAGILLVAPVAIKNVCGTDTCSGSILAGYMHLIIRILLSCTSQRSDSFSEIHFPSQVCNRT
ncbi:MAG: hypothetical protein PHU68_04945 [Paludibacter sp.]|nr:hypothetical protein [Paludibacter sp.]